MHDDSTLCVHTVLSTSSQNLQYPAPTMANSYMEIELQEQHGWKQERALNESGGQQLHKMLTRNKSLYQ